MTKCYLTLLDSQGECHSIKITISQIVEFILHKNENYIVVIFHMNKKLIPVEGKYWMIRYYMVYYAGRNSVTDRQANT